VQRTPKPPWRGPSDAKTIENSCHYALIESPFVASVGAAQRGHGLDNRSAERRLARQCIWCDIVALLLMAPKADKKK
jgi:hypothetical protein